jgi:hypothetical protein
LTASVGSEPRVELAGLRIADPVDRWQALGFAIDRETVRLGGIEIELGVNGEGIVGWALRHMRTRGDVDGLVTNATNGDQPVGGQPHPNGAAGIDHVVVTTPDFDRTADALTAAGMPLRRIREAGSFRQGFRRLGPAILELVEAVNAPPGPARFWGLVVVVEDLPALSERLGAHLGSLRPAVQSGRQIATLAASAGLGTKVAFMDPER